MSNRDGKNAKRSKSKAKQFRTRICPNCQSSLEKGKDHRSHRYCLTCNWSNF